MQNYNLRAAKQSDIIWIAGMLKDGANEGHFNKSIINSSVGLITAITNNQKINFTAMRGTIDDKQDFYFDLLVLDINDKPVSFLVLKSGQDGLELHLAGTKTQYRRKGYFQHIANHVIQQYKHSRIYARCYKKSTFAMAALKKIGFEKVKDGDPIELELNQKSTNSTIESILKFLRIK